MPTFRLSLKQALCLSFTFHLLAAWYSVGYYNHDEQQVLEFTSWWLGKADSSLFDWQFHREIRSFAMPLFYGGIAKCFSFFFVQNPFIWAFAYRLVGSLIGFLSAFLVICSLKRWFPEKKEWELQLISNFILLAWFVPWLHSRTNAENLCSSFFLFGLVSLTQYQGSLFSPLRVSEGVEKRKLGYLCLAALFLGVAFWIRFQAGILVFSLGCWLLLNKKMPFFHLVLLTLLTAFVSGSVLFIDYLGYGHWTFSPANFVKVNFFEDALGLYGKRPLWSYVFWGIRSYPPLSLLGVAFFGFGMLRFWKTLWVWLVFPFFLLHSLISWKELRFLFPIFPEALLLSGLGFLSLGEKAKAFFLGERIKRITFVLTLFGLLFTSLKPASSMVFFYQYVYEHYPKRFEYVAVGGDPYVFLGMKQYFYSPEVLLPHLTENWEKTQSEFLNQKSQIHVFFEKMPRSSELNEKCRLEYSTIPKWLLRFNYGHWVERSRNWSLYRCDFG